MRAVLIWFGLATLTAIIVHFAVVFTYPNRIMEATMERVSQGGRRVNTWVHAPRVTENSRSVVRPSPDLAYSVCVYDLNSGPVEISIEPWGDYMSLSLFAANTDNFYTLNDRAMPEGGARVILRRQSQTLSSGESERAFAVVDSPSGRGIALVRRLAATAERFAAADAVRRRESCALLERR